MGATGNTISYINFKNGVTEYDDFTINLNTDQQAGIYICIDEGNESLFPSNVYANPNILVSNYCSFTPGGSYNTIEGNLTFDSDNNGCGLDDAYSGFVRMNIDNGIESFSTFTASGLYNFYVQSGTFTLTPQIDNEWFIATPPSATINLATVVNSTMTQNFCIIANGFHPDVEVVIVPIVAAQPGFDANYKVVYRNKGNQALSGTVTLNYDDAVLDYVSAIPVESTSSTGLLSWNYVNLLPFESRSILLTLNVNGPMETPAINLNDVLAFSASVTPATGDETPTDNAFALEQVVVGSYDPNDITCLEGESVDPSKIGEYLHYNINFENTGTAPATFIVVKDMIDEAKFDINTLQVLYASHAVETRVTGNKVEFYFGDINLAALGKGNVVFKIKTLNTLQVNDDVAQQADIFFDYNWPIETNEAVTVFEVLSLGEYETDNSVKVYPNPAKNRVTITAASQVELIEVYDMQGRLLQSAIVNGTEVEMDLSSRSNGVYFVKVETDRGMKVEKIIKE
ncbi:T9SS type A sorting domain-containing protein [Flavobacterium sp. MFBS3-15]|uniref:T9SS type A sorting domain-containing protein n=1 Tax=Flavobacterium sp. MFBS3-15 TaxID=2989816 RepID=UPI0022369A05|nr:T9SS type A sorting domain-containing protein [Flavobacterium sp. MFBS3-15]MCW4467390.1 T9SS type A sorting domain-containing protein [Flavobacterium sp. MFBS3-15]